MKSLNLAPVGLSVYSRFAHVQQTVTALLANTLARETELYVFSDAPRPGDEEAVEAVRVYLRSIVGFKHVEIVERSENNRVKNNRNGMRQLLDAFGKMIWIEEDIVTAPGFLTFMNSALDFYEADPRVFSICGYSPPLKLNLSVDVFALARFCAWGFAMTRASFESIAPIPVDAIDTIDQDRLSDYGDDIYKMLCLDALGEIDALDVKAMYYQYQTGGLTIYPSSSLVQNVGNDGTGLHCAATRKYDQRSLWTKRDAFRFIEGIVPEPIILKRNRKFRAAKRTKRLKKWIRGLRLYQMFK